jgi:hypothetical protein
VPHARRPGQFPKTVPSPPALLREHDAIIIARNPKTLLD